MIQNYDAFNHSIIIIINCNAKIFLLATIALIVNFCIFFFFLNASTLDIIFQTELMVAGGGVLCNEN